MNAWDIKHARHIVEQSYNYYLLDFDHRLHNKHVRVDPKEFKYYNYVCHLISQMDEKRQQFYGSISLPSINAPADYHIDHKALRVTLECIIALYRGLDNGIDMNTLKEDPNAHLGRHGVPKHGQDAINQQNSMYRRRIDSHDASLVFHQLIKPYLASLSPDGIEVAKALNTHFTPTEIVEMLLDYEDPLVPSDRTMKKHFAAAQALNHGEPDRAQFYYSSKVIDKMNQTSPKSVHAHIKKQAELSAPKRAHRFADWIHKMNWFNPKKSAEPVHDQHDRKTNWLKSNNHSQRNKKGF